MRRYVDDHPGSLSQVGAPPKRVSDLVPKYISHLPQCPYGYEYELNPTPDDQIFGKIYVLCPSKLPLHDYSCFGQDVELQASSAQ
ncbi:hypothetical protein HY256_10075 [Candidatus Sumerlaeota bacterium]|nr:hypothetical protein [Candidatus Sumerlaeota bacterium]